MNRRLLTLCGLIAPALFVFTALLGGAIHPGYSHMSDAVSELFSPGSPNRFLLSVFYSLFAVLLVLFGIGLLQIVRRYESSQRIGILGALAFIAVGVLNFMTATLFPQDAWMSPPTVFGEMHIILHGVISVLSILYILLLGIWIYRAGVAPFFMPYSLFTIAAAVLTAAWFIENYGTPIMGLSERVTALVGFQWMIVLALLMHRQERVPV